MPRRVAILGSTGSIGVSALEVIARLPARLRVSGLSAHRRVDALVGQCRAFSPSAVAVSDESQAAALRVQTDATVYAGPDALRELVVRDDVDMVLAATVGVTALPAIRAAIGAGKSIALANKEALVVAGSILIPEARERGVRILPVDSEHSAVFQAMLAGRISEVRRVILTASGGPFRDWSIERMRDATPQDALNHPTWQMGHKITIDSATMFNKALEIIEAVWLFGLPPEKVEVSVHPESMIHSMVEFEDGNVIAQLSPPDMKTPIQYALTWPDRLTGAGRRLDLTRGLRLTLEPPDVQRFAAIRLGYEAARAGGTMGAVLNAANEAAVEAFSAGRIGFGRIAEAVEATMNAHRVVSDPTMEDLMSADAWARQRVAEWI